MSIEPYNSDTHFDEVLSLYEAVNWLAYTREPDVLRAALRDSSTTLVYRVDGLVVGLTRCISDGHTICYVQDLLVHPDHQRRGIGTELMRTVLQRYNTVRQLVLMTDDEDRQRQFYESLGFRLIENDLRGFVRFRQD